MAKQRFQPKLHIKVGDTVKVISGDSKGITGKVLAVFAERNRAVVEGANMVKKHIRPSAGNPGQIIEKEASIHISNLMLVDAKGNVTRIGRRVENGKSVRYSKKSNEVI